jgi:hypothetical protein
MNGEGTTMRANDKVSGNPRFKVEFPCDSECSRFLEQVEVWNRVDDLPRIEVEPLPDDRAVSFWCADCAHVGPFSLIDSHLGRISAE